jgi:hypothetical protein
MAILDGIANLARAYSTRLLRTGYGGNCCEIKDAGGSNTLQVGFSGGWRNDAAIASFEGSFGPSHVTQWYDQVATDNMTVSGGGTSTNVTPLAAGINGRPTMVFGSAGFFLNTNVAQTANYTVLGVVKSTSSAAQLMYSSDFVGTLRMAHYLRYDAGPDQFDLIAFDSTLPNGANFSASKSCVLTSPHVLSCMLNGTVISVSVDGVAGTNGTLGGTGVGASGTTELNIGADRTGGGQFVGQLSEIVHIGAASATDRATIEADQITTFLTTAGPPKRRGLTAPNLPWMP